MTETRNIEQVAFDKKCIDFDGEFRCPECKVLLVPVCVNLGMCRSKDEGQFYCSGRRFGLSCSEPEYKIVRSYVYWEELANYRLTGQLYPRSRRSSE